ncbi:MAG: PKD domain-containing protein, partial [Bacteroidota bacterium]
TPDTTAGCVPFAVPFANNSSVLQGQIDSIRWTVDGDPNDYGFVGGTSATSFSPEIRFEVPRDYEVCAVLYNGCDIDTVCFELVGRDVPTTTLNPLDTTICIGDDVLMAWNIVSTNAIDSVTFFNGLGDILVNPLISAQLVTFDTLGIFMPIIQAENVCGASSDTATINVQALPVVDAGNDIAICVADGCINLTQGTPSGGFWEGPGITDSIAGIFCPDLIGAGIYEVIYCFNDGLCTGCDTLTITVHPSPVAGFTLVDGDSLCGIPNVLDLENNSTQPASYSWTIPNGNPATSSANEPVIALANTGEYPITLIVTDSNGCTAAATDTLYVLPDPVAALEASPASGCAPLEVTFLNTSTDATSAFLDVDISDNQPPISIGSSFTHIYQTPDMYTARLIVGYENFCFDTTEVIIDAASGTVADFEMNISGDSCGGPLNVNFVNQSTDAIDYEWDFGNGQTSTETNPNTTYSGVGQYIITLVSFHPFGCTDTVRDTVEVFPQPQALFGDIVEGCEDLTVRFSSLNNDDVTSWLWEFGNGDTATGPDPSYTYTEPGTYDVTLTVGYQGVCFDQLTGGGAVTVYPSPIAGFLAADTTNMGVNTGAVIFTDLSIPDSGLTYLWNFGEPSSPDNTSTLQNPSHVYDQNGAYTVTLIVENEFECPDTARSTVSPEGFGDLFIPNAFIPRRNDPFHNIFMPIGVGLAEFEIEVYDPLGELIWESSALVDGRPSEWWDGTKNGELMNPDAYLWVVKKAIFQDGRVWQGMKYEDWQKPSRYGTVTLID